MQCALLSLDSQFARLYLSICYYNNLSYFFDLISPSLIDHIVTIAHRDAQAKALGISDEVLEKRAKRFGLAPTEAPAQSS